MLSVEMLAARYGDSLLVTWGAPGDKHRMLIDAGLAGAYPAIKARLGELDCDIDLFVVTHVDTDHVGGAVKLLADDEVAQRVAGVWFNGYVHLEQFSDILGALDGERLTALIRARAMTWNEGWPDAPNDECGGAIVVRDVPPVVEVGGGATITLLSPTPDKLRRLHDVWLKAITKAGLVDGTEGVRDEAEADRIADLLGSLADLADVRSDPDDAEANGSSIAFVFEHEGVRILFGGDAHSDALLASLAHLAPEGERYRVDACKLPHHGSRRNVSSAFVARLDCSYWWFSSNGVQFHHPNDEAIARVIRYGSPGARLAGNYRSDRWAAFTAAHPPSENGYALELPDEGCEGLMITLDPPARAAGAAAARSR